MNIYSSRRIISYCVPVMNRLTDLKASLKHNLLALESFSDVADLHIACFDVSTECQEWVQASFSDQLRNGLLKFHQLPSLPFWHFCWAKNAFKSIIDSTYYSSLDGDNFLSETDIAATLEVLHELGEHAFIHHFSGNWGDGTSGRITMPTRLYRKYGYIEELLPRQFDEISLILNILKNESDVAFVVRPGVDIFNLSPACSTFRKLNNLRVRCFARDLGLPPAPLNPRGEGYVAKDVKLQAFQGLNMNYSLLRLSSEEQAKNYFAKSLKEVQDKLAHSDVLPSLLRSIFDGPGLPALSTSDVLTVYAVVKNDSQFLEPWYQHYKGKGVERFIIVDDHSDRPIESVLDRSDVFVLRPRVGDFRSFKVFWLMTLMKAFQKPDSWVVTVDSDEFIDVPGTGSNTTLTNFVRLLEAHNLSWVPGVLLEMMPTDTATEINAENFIQRMDSFYFRPFNERYGYQDFPSVKWAFGSNWGLSFSIDLRWRLFGTLDCLRKFPLFRYGHGVTLNQGFHALYIHGKEIPLERIWSSSNVVLPVRHYKMYKLLSSDYDLINYRQQFGAYFSRTTTNLAKIFAAGKDEVCRAWRLTPFKHRYSGPEAFTSKL